jgi:hypothetical protein
MCNCQLQAVLERRIAQNGENKVTEWNGSSLVTLRARLLGVKSSIRQTLVVRRRVSAVSNHAAMSRAALKDAVFAIGSADLPDRLVWSFACLVPLQKIFCFSLC